MNSFRDQHLFLVLPWLCQITNKLYCTGKAFQHQTIIEEIVSEEDKVMVKIQMALKHIGKWRGIEPTGKNVFTKGYRYFKIADNKIIEHWALIDGSTIEHELTDKAHGCKIQK